MAVYRHQVSGVFPHRAQAESAREQLVGQGIRAEGVRILGAEDLPSGTHFSRNRRAFGQMLASAVAGALLGLVVSTLAAATLMHSDAGLLSGNLLALLGWSSALGALLGGMVGALADTGQIAKSFSYAIAHGNVVLLAETHSQRETLLARDLIEGSPGAGTHMDISLI
ncbi:hypothetical protein D9M71_115000 [compost metagenome]